MKKTNDEPKFKYGVNLHETVPDGQNSHVLRYGRARDRQFQHMGDDAPFRDDGALFDRLNPLQKVMPTNVTIQKGVLIPTGTGHFKIMPDQVLVS